MRMAASLTVTAMRSSNDDLDDIVPTLDRAAIGKSVPKNSAVSLFSGDAVLHRRKVAKVRDEKCKRTLNRVVGYFGLLPLS